MVRWTAIMEEREGPKTVSQRYEDLEIHRQCWHERQATIRCCYQLATRSEQFHAQKIHQKVHEKAFKRVSNTNT